MHRTAWYSCYKARLTDLLREHCPVMLHTLDLLMEEFPGNEHLIYSELCGDFNVAPLATATAADLLQYGPQHEQLLRIPSMEYLGIPSMDCDIALGADPDDTISLVSSLGTRCTKHEIDKESAMMSNLVRNILEGDSGADTIQIRKVCDRTLKLIVAYLKHHKGKAPVPIAMPICSANLEKLVRDKWDATFINSQSMHDVFQLILGANYMDIESLLHLGCAKIATMIKGKSPDEIG